MKPFKETRFGKFLGSKGVDIALGVGGMVYPPLSAVDSIKDMIMGDRHPDIKLNDMEKRELMDSYAEYLQLVDMEMKDLANARVMYSQKSEMTDRIARWVMVWNMPMILFCLFALCASTLYLQEAMLALVSAVIGGVINSLINERQQVANFFLGSSVGSKRNAEALQKKLNDGN